MGIQIPKLESSEDQFYRRCRVAVWRRVDYWEVHSVESQFHLIIGVPLGVVQQDDGVFLPAWRLLVQPLDHVS